MKVTIRRLLAGTAIATAAIFGVTGVPGLLAVAQAQEAPMAATGVTQADIDALIAKAPADVTVTYGAVTTDAAMGTTTIENLAIAQKSGDGKLEIAKIVLTGFDKDALERVVSPERYTGTPEEDFRTIASSIQIEGVTVTAAGATVAKIASQTVEGWRMKQFAISPADFGGSVAMGNPAGGFKTIGAVIDAIQVDRIAMQGLEIDATIPAMGGNPPQKIAYKVASVEQTALDRGKAGMGTMTGLEGLSEQEIPGFGPLKLDFTLASSTVESLDFTGAVAWMIKGELPPVTERNLMNIGAFTFTDYVINVDRIGKIAFPSINQPAIPFDWLIPKSMELSAEGTFEPVPADQFAAGPDMRALFLDSAPASFTFGWKYDGDAGTAELTSYGFSLGGWGLVDFGGKVGGLKLADIMSLPERFAELLTFDGAFAKIDDDGGFDKGLALYLKEMGGGEGAPAMTPEQVRDMMKMSIDGSMMMFQGAPAATAMADAIKSFIDKPGTLEMRAVPPSPLKMADLTALQAKPPAEWFDVLGLTTSYSE